jgi:hypothetical protein
MLLLTSCSRSGRDAHNRGGHLSATLLAVSGDALVEFDLDGNQIANFPNLHPQLTYRVSPDGRTVGWIDVTSSPDAGSLTWTPSETTNIASR